MYIFIYIRMKKITSMLVIFYRAEEICNRDRVVLSSQPFKGPGYQIGKI